MGEIEDFLSCRDFFHVTSSTAFTSRRRHQRVDSDVATEHRNGVKLAFRYSARPVARIAIMRYLGGDFVKKLIVAQLSKKFPIFYETCSFITVPTTAATW